jgi:hypothetical protein
LILGVIRLKGLVPGWTFMHASDVAEHIGTGCVF